MARSTRWGPDDIGDLTGRTVLITGANSGIGYEAAVELAAHGALVVLGCRDQVKGEVAADRIVGYSPKAAVEVLTVDLASQASVRRAADRFLADHARLDVLVNNAGIMGTPFSLSEDGFELQFATNHLGPFALTGRLLELLLTTSGSRVVTVSSHMHHVGHLNFSNLQGLEHPYGRWPAYGNTKLANLAFTYELERRLRAADAPTIAVAVHPGWARTPSCSGPSRDGTVRFDERVEGLIGRLGQSAAGGARPTLYAATAPGVRGGEFYGPAHAAQLFGPPKRVRSVRRSRRPADLERLWAVSEELTGVHYPWVAGIAAS